MSLEKNNIRSSRKSFRHSIAVTTQRLALGLFLSLALAASVGATTITVSGHQLLVNCSPFLVRGVNYSPVPIADNQQEWAYIYDVAIADFAQMNVMGVNAIRCYFSYAALFNADGTVNAAMYGNYTRLLAAAAAQGIYVIPNFWVTYNTDYTNATNLNTIETQFAAVINLFKNSATFPNILMWVLGDENNNSANLSPMTDTEMFQFYQTVIAYEKANADTTHPYSVALVQNGDINNTALTSLVPSIDVWSMNVYQATSADWSSSVISSYALSQPLLITEFGNDAYNNNTGTEDDTDQAAFFNDVWPNAIGANLSALNSSNKLLGGCVFEWNDEWWKCSGGAATHESCGETLSVLPDNYGNEAWFGLANALPIDDSGPRTYRAAFNTLEGYWKASPYNVNVPVVCGTSPTPTPTITSTPTPSYGAGCVTVVDDFNNGNGATDTFGGTWSTSFGSGSGGSLNYLAPGYSEFSMQFAYNIVTGSYGECFANLSSTANPTGAGTGTVNLSSYGEVTFWVTAAVPGAYLFKIASTQTYGGASYSWWQASFNATTSWTQVVLPFNTTVFTNPNGNSGTLPQNLTTATSLVFQPGVADTYVWIDDVDLVSASCLNTNTPTSTPSKTPTATATKTATLTATNTPASTNTFTSTPSSTFTTTATNTVANTNTATLTPSATFSSTVSNTYTATATLTKTLTATNSPTVTSANTSTPADTSTPSATFTNTFSSTFTATKTSTATNSPTLTPLDTYTVTNTFTASPTSTLSSTFTNTPTSTSTPTITLTATITPTYTVTNTFTATDSSTATSSPTLTPTQTNTPTLTDTATNTNTPTPTLTGTNTFTATLSNTPTTTPTGTLTPPLTATPTNSSTFTATQTYTPSATFTNTDTSTPTNSPALTSTFTNTATRTPSSTATLTVTLTQTSTPTYTATSTYTAVIVNTATPTLTFTSTVTNTFTPVFTGTPSFTPTLTLTATVFYTATPTVVTGTIVGGPYPNPSQGQPINVWVEISKPATIKLTVFTTAFRKISNIEIPMSQSGNVQWNLRDVEGNPAADGLYYLRVEVVGNTASSRILKVLVLR